MEVASFKLGQGWKVALSPLESLTFPFRRYVPVLKRKSTRFLALGLLLFSVVLSSYNTHASPSGRRQIGPGEKVNFSAHTPVIAAQITLFHSDGSPGRTWYSCYMRSPHRSGYAIGEGALDYATAEIAGKTPCSRTKPNPGPMFYTGPGVTMRIEAGHIVEAVAIEQVGGPGKTAFKCVMRLTTASFVTDGTIDPHPAIIAAATPCSDTEQNPGRRTNSGNGKLFFRAGVRVLANYIEYVDGSIFHDCWIDKTTSDGFLTGGVRNYWPGQNSDLPVCR